MTLPLCSAVLKMTYVGASITRPRAADGRTCKVFIYGYDRKKGTLMRVFFHALTALYLFSHSTI